MSNIETAFSNWQDTVKDVYKIIFSSPEAWNPKVWIMIKNINSTMIIIGSSLIGLFFLYGFLKKSFEIRELKRPETYFLPFLRLVIAKLFMIESLNLMSTIFKIIQASMSQIAGTGAASFNQKVPKAIVNILSDTSDFSGEGIMMGILGLLLIVVIFVMGLILKIVVWGRFIKIYLHIGAAPPFIATLASSETQGTFIAFTKSFINVCFQGVIVVIALMIYSALQSALPTDISGASDMEIVMKYSANVLVAGFVMLGICKGGDSIATKMGL